MEGQIFHQQKQVYNGFWLGEVMDVMDPLFNGRVQVKLFGLFDEIEDKDLPWARPVLPPTGGLSGIGKFLVPKVGSHLLCVIPNNNPNLVYFLGVAPSMKPGSSIPMWQERLRPGGGGAGGDVLETRNKNLVKDKDTKCNWNEPKDNWEDCKYPNRQSLIITETGVSIEVDDTPDNETILIYHPKGSYIELRPDGDVIVHANKDLYLLADENLYKSVKGNQGEHVKGNKSKKISGDSTSSTSGDSSSCTLGNNIVTLGGGASEDSDTEEGKGEWKYNIHGPYKLRVKREVEIESKTNIVLRHFRKRKDIGDDKDELDPVGGVATTLCRCRYTGTSHPGSSTVFASN